MPISKSLAAPVASLVLLAAAGCTTQEPVPELVEALRPGPEAPAEITGAPVAECLADQKDARATWESSATYSPLVTYKYAAGYQRTLDRKNEHASRLRIYQVSGTGPGPFGFGEADRHLACFYDMRDGKLRFLTSMKLEDENHVMAGDSMNASNIAWRKLSGQGFWEVFWTSDPEVRPPLTRRDLPPTTRSPG